MTAMMTGHLMEGGGRRSSLLTVKSPPPSPPLRHFLDPSGCVAPGNAMRLQGEKKAKEGNPWKPFGNQLIGPASCGGGGGGGEQRERESNQSLLDPGPERTWASARDAERSARARVWGWEWPGVLWAVPWILVVHLYSSSNLPHLLMGLRTHFHGSANPILCIYFIVSILSQVKLPSSL